LLVQALANPVLLVQVLVQVLAMLALGMELVAQEGSIPLHMEMNTSNCLVGCTGHRLLLAPSLLRIQNQMQTIVHI